MHASGSCAEPAPPFRRFTIGRPVLEEWAAAACAGVDLDHLARVIVGRCVAVFRQEAVDEAFEASLHHSVAQNLGILIDLLEGVADLTRVRVESPLSFAQMQAELDIPQAELQRSYRVSFLTVWEHLADAVAAAAVRHDVERVRVIQATRDLASAVFTYQDFIVSRAAEKYTLVEGTLGQSRARVRQQLIRELLRTDGQALPPADLAQLGYDLSLHHVAVVLPGTPAADAESMLRALRRAGLVTDGLLFARSMTSSVVWLGLVRPWTDDTLAPVQSAVLERGADAVLGDSHPGPEGLRRSYAQAMQVLDLLGPVIFGRDHGREAGRVVRYSQVALDLLLMSDMAMAESFVMKTLGELAADTADASRLCDTVEASLRLGSHVAAAEALGVHEQTVRNRLAKAESLIGARVRARRTELEVALRIRRLMMGQDDAARGGR